MSGLEYRTIRSNPSIGPNSLDNPELGQLKLAFASLDAFAACVESKCELVMETTNVAADILRGVVAKVHGIDIRPTSEIGPHDEVDLAHSLGVLGRLVEEALRAAAGLNGRHDPTQSSLPTTAPLADVDRRLTEIETRVAKLGMDPTAPPSPARSPIDPSISDTMISGSRDLDWPGRLTTIELVRASS